MPLRQMAGLGGILLNKRWVFFVVFGYEGTHAMFPIEAYYNGGSFDRTVGIRDQLHDDL